jgi:hypothetical protein
MLTDVRSSQVYRRRKPPNERSFFALDPPRSPGQFCFPDPSTKYILPAMRVCDMNQNNQDF